MTPKAKTSKLPSLSLRIDLDEGRIGPGKIHLLENIHSCGSIAAAGRAMNMSFKHAWDLVNDLNRICECPVIEPEKGGRDGGGSALTPFGLSLIDRYRSIERLVTPAAREELLGLRADIERKP